MISQLKEYLSFYKTTLAPGYALLVTGAWGVGKTFQVRDALGKDEYHYVSLYGLQTTDEIFSAVISSMFPSSSKAQKFLGNLGSQIGRIGGLFSLAELPSSFTSAYLRRKVNSERILIFDDLERCNLAMHDKLSVINSYIEHHGCRVIVIANEEELDEEQRHVEFGHVKEKHFGRTIKVEPQITEAFGNFCGSLEPPDKREFVRRYSGEIIEAFKAAEVQSLRILKHTIEDIGRLHGALTERHLNHAEAMTELVGLFSALNLETRSGRLSKEDLDQQNRNSWEELLSEEAPQTPFAEAAKKYQSINLFSKLLRDDAVIDMLIDGRYTHELIRKSLDASLYFLPPEESSPWEVVINFNEIDDEEVERARQKMQDQFDGREVTNPGEILHVFSLNLLMARHKILSDDIPTVVRNCKQYIDDLLSDDRLPPRPTQSQWSRDEERGYAGHGYWVEDEYREEFDDLFSYLNNAREKALEKQFPAITARLLTLVETDASAFRGLVSVTKDGGNDYVEIPILAHIAPEDFVTAWLRSPKKNWRQIYSALSERYQGRNFSGELEPEKQWVLSVIQIMEAEAEKSDGFAAYRIERITPSYLTIRIQLEDAAKNEASGST
jgi:hypothetical protein